MKLFIGDEWVYRNPPYFREERGGPEKVTCEICDKEVVVSRLNNHQKSNKCITRGREKDLIAKDFVPIKVKAGNCTKDQAKMFEDIGVPVYTLPLPKPKYYIPCWAQATIDAIRYCFQSHTKDMTIRILKQLVKNKPAQNIINKLRHEKIVLGRHKIIAPPAFILSYEEPEYVNTKRYEFFRWLETLENILERGDISFSNNELDNSELEELLKYPDKACEVIDSIGTEVWYKQRAKERAKRIKEMLRRMMKCHSL